MFHNSNAKSIKAREESLLKGLFMLVRFEFGDLINLRGLAPSVQALKLIYSKNQKKCLTYNIIVNVILINIISLTWDKDRSEIELGTQN